MAKAKKEKQSEPVVIEPQVQETVATEELVPVVTVAKEDHTPPVWAWKSVRKIGSPEVGGDELPFLDKLLSAIAAGAWDKIQPFVEARIVELKKQN